MIQQAVVLSEDRPTTGKAPRSTRVAGLSMLKRTLVMLQWAGVQETFVVVGPWDGDASRRSIEADRDLDAGRMRIRWAVDAEAENRGGLALAPVARSIRGRALVLRADTIYDRRLVSDLMDERVDDGEATVLMDGDRVVGLSACDHAAISAFNGHTLDVALDAFDREGRLQRRDVRNVDESAFHVRVTDDASAKRAEDLLWDSCRKPNDGIVARNLNRPISLFISRRIAHLPIAPNHISIITFLLGIATAWSVAQGGYWWFLLGAALFKLNSVLDGVDGELARVKYKMSVVGEWLDTLSDDVSNMLFFVALSIGAFRATGVEMWLTLGLLTAVPSLLATAHQYTLLIRHGRGDLLAIRWAFERGNGKGDAPRSRFGSFMDNLKYVVKKDFFVFLVFLMAVAGQLPWALFLTTAANLLLVATIIANEVVVFRMRRRGHAVERVVTGAQAIVPTPETAGAERRVRPLPARR